MRKKSKTDRMGIDLENINLSHKEGFRSWGSSLHVILTAENGIAALNFASRIIQYHLGITEYDELFGNIIFLKLKSGTAVQEVVHAEQTYTSPQQIHTFLRFINRDKLISFPKNVIDKGKILHDVCLRGSKFTLAYINKTTFPKPQQEKRNDVTPLKDNRNRQLFIEGAVLSAAGIYKLSSNILREENKKQDIYPAQYTHTSTRFKFENKSILIQTNTIIVPRLQQEKGNKIIPLIQSRSHLFYMDKNILSASIGYNIVQRILRKENRHTGILSVRSREKNVERLAEYLKYIKRQSRGQRIFPKGKVGYEGYEVYTERNANTSACSIYKGHKRPKTISKRSIAQLLESKTEKSNDLKSDFILKNVRESKLSKNRMMEYGVYSVKQIWASARFIRRHTFTHVQTNLITSFWRDLSNQYTKKEEYILNQSVYTAFDQMGKQEKVFVKKNVLNTRILSQITKYIQDSIATFTKNMPEEKEQKTTNRVMVDKLEAKIHQQEEQIKNLKEMLQKFEKWGDEGRNDLLGEEKYFYIFENDLTLEQMRYGII